MKSKEIEQSNQMNQVSKLQSFHSCLDASQNKTGLKKFGTRLKEQTQYFDAVMGEENG